MYNHEKTIELVLKAQKGDMDAKNQLVTENSPLVKSVIKRFKNKNIEYDDLFQLGSMGLLKAINNFDTSFNVRFSTYCVPMIIGEVKRFLRDDGSIKVSRAIKSLNMQITKFVDEFTAENSQPPTTKQIANHFNLDEAETVFIMDSSKMPVSLHAPVNDFSTKNQFLIDKLDQDFDGDALYDRISLKNTLSGLEPRDKQIVLMRFFKDKTQSEIAKVMGISQVQVSRLENKILEKLKDKLE